MGNHGLLTRERQASGKAKVRAAQETVHSRLAAQLSTGTRPAPIAIATRLGAVDGRDRAHMPSTAAYGMARRDADWSRS
jgi:hypothetical protein